MTWLYVTFVIEVFILGIVVGASIERKIGPDERNHLRNIHP